MRKAFLCPVKPMSFYLSSGVVNMGTVCRRKAGCKNFFQQQKKRQLKIQCFGVFEDENLNKKKSA